MNTEKKYPNSESLDLMMQGDYDPMEKALSNYNYEAAKKLQEIKSFRTLGFSNTGELRKIEKTKVVRNSVWWTNFFKSQVIQLRP